MATVILTAVIIVIVIAASLWSGGLSSIYTRYEDIEVKNANITSKDGEHTVTVQYENVGSTETSVEDVLINDVPYSDYTPTPKLGGDLGSLPSACETGVPKVGTITFRNGATDPSGNRLSNGVALIISIQTSHGQTFQAAMVLDGGSLSSTTPEGNETGPSNPSEMTDNGTSIVEKTDNGTRSLRLGANVASSVIRGFGKRHGIAIDMSYEGGKAFYDYMTKEPGFFAHINYATGSPYVWDWGNEREFIKGMLDAADADDGRCEISITLYKIDLGWPGWEPLLYEILEAVGPNRPCMRFMFLAGEWSYFHAARPSYEELKPDFLKASRITASYGYQLGWYGEGKYFEDIPKEYWSELRCLGPRYRAGQLSRDPDVVKGAQEAYKTANCWENPTDVFLDCFTMWDTPANVPTTPPYYVCFEKFDSFIKGAADRFRSSNGTYPQMVSFEIMPETFNDVEGVNCPYLDWWAQLAQKYELRTSHTDPVPVPKPPDVVRPPSPFPPYTVIVHVTMCDENLPPFQAQAGGEFHMVVYARDIHNWKAAGNREVEIYLVKQQLEENHPWKAYPVTKEQWENRILVGKITTKSDGWSDLVILKTPLQTEQWVRYAVVARISTSSQEIPGPVSFSEFLLTTTKAHRVEIRTNIRMKVWLKPTAYMSEGDVDADRWVEPSKSLWGWLSETDYTFIVPEKVVDGTGKTWVFDQWDDGSADLAHTVFIDRDLILTAIYREDV